ncbi:MAG: SDR family NAD(P)-dependent oxidoreductase [Betaproteobacteria bacterium]|nr:SDR family NAD(P)-dependent oxidoreductase [Betaproteobacteria bacterium]
MSKKTILITGVSRGLGRALTEKFIALGHTVIGCGRDPKAIAALKKQYGPPHRFDAVDVADDAQVKHWAEVVLADHDPPDLLLNNAALINRLAPLWEVPQAEFDVLIDVNIKGVANVIRHFVPAMVARKHGVICNFSSGWGRSTDAFVAPYCASKWAMEGLTQALAQELPKGMAAIPLSPGIINTEMLQSCFGTDVAAYPTAEQWAEDAVPWLLKLGPKDNGQSLTVGD